MMTDHEQKYETGIQATHALILPMLVGFHGFDPILQNIIRITQFREGGKKCVLVFSIND